MDNPIDDRDKGHDQTGSTGELEEALKWLEELTARQGKPAELTNPVPATSLDSPFRGLIDSDEGDLPDWLRELPTPSGDRGLVEGEPESRLDWLAKMAQRESIEELPTLEWRRLSEPLQSAILGNSKMDLMPSANELASTEIEGVPADTPVLEVEELPASAVIASSVEIKEGIAAAPPLEPESELSDLPIALASIDIIEDIVDARPNQDVEIAPVVESNDLSLSASDETLPPVDDLDAAMAWIEELAASQDAPIEDLPSVADRALASKLMVEAGLNPTFSPLDEFGSDPSLMDSLTPTHPFIEEEDFADTVVLVETLAADQGMAEPPDEEELPVIAAEMVVLGATGDIPGDRESDTLDQITAYDETLPELSFEEAMAYLDTIATQPDLETSTDLMADESGGQPAGDVSEPGLMVMPPDEESSIDFALDHAGVEGVEEAVVIEELFDEGTDGIADLDEDMPDESGNAGSLEVDIETELEGEFESLEEVATADEFTPWLDHGDDSLAVIDTTVIDTDVSPLSETIALNGREPSDLEAALLSLDALALPPGKSLEQIDSSLQTAQITTWRDVNSALDWLEATLTGEATTATFPATDLDEADIIAQMPEDPDAVLAWLERMSDEESAAAPALPTYEQPTMAMTDSARSAPLVEELAEADLLNMPDDPDEAMAWLESLAREGKPAGSEVPSVHTEPVEAYLPDIPSSPDLVEIVTPDELVADEMPEPLAGEVAVESFVEAPAAGTAVEPEPSPVHPIETEPVVESIDIAAIVVPSLETDATATEPPAEAASTVAASQKASRRRRQKPATEVVTSHEPLEPVALQEKAEAPEEADQSEEEYQHPAADEAAELSWIDLLKPLE